MAGAHAHLYRKNRWKVKSEEFRKRNPLCVSCLAKGIVKASQVADHVTPHKGDETVFWDGQLQALCKDCHDLKSIVEDASAGGTAQTHPEWLPKPACRVVLVCGPPGSGKTTWAKAQATKQDLVVDLDDCFEAVCGAHGHEAEHTHLTAALRYRNKLLAGLASRQGTAYVIVSAPTILERNWWTDKLGASVQLLDPGLRVIESRVAGKRLQAARTWYAKAKANDWKNPNKQGFNEDGSPIGGW